MEIEYRQMEIKLSKVDCQEQIDSIAVGLHAIEVQLRGMANNKMLRFRAQTVRQFLDLAQILQYERLHLENYVLALHSMSPDIDDVDKFATTSQALIKRGLIPGACPVNQDEINKMFVTELLWDQADLEDLSDDQIKSISSCIVDSGASFDNLK